VSVLLVTLAISIVLLVICVARPRMLTAGLGEVFGFIAILVLPFLVVLMGISQ
jgi:hypothetical protein